MTIWVSHTIQRLHWSKYVDLANKSLRQVGIYNPLDAPSRLVLIAAYWTTTLVAVTIGFLPLDSFVPSGQIPYVMAAAYGLLTLSSGFILSAFLWSFFTKKRIQYLYKKVSANPLGIQLTSKQFTDLCFDQWLKGELWVFEFRSWYHLPHPKSMVDDLLYLGDGSPPFIAIMIFEDETERMLFKIKS